MSIKKFKLLNGKEVAKSLSSSIIQKIDSINTKISVKAILAGDDPGAEGYAKAKAKKAGKLGIDYEIVKFESDVSTSTLKNEIEKLNDDDSVHGIIIERPLPKQVNFDELIKVLSPLKDVDCATSHNLGLILQDNAAWYPATADAVLRILDFYEIPTEAKNIVIIGRSLSVGLPLSNMLLSKKRNATVTVCHSRTKKLSDITQQADILVAAVGHPKFVNSGMIKENTVIVDVGTNYTDDGLFGDVDFDEIKDKAEAITPVPGGVGPVTVNILFENCLKAFELADK